MPEEEEIAKKLFNEFYGAITPNAYREQEAKKCALICIRMTRELVFATEGLDYDRAIEIEKCIEKIKV